MPISKSLNGVDPELAERVRMLLAFVPGSWVSSAFRSNAEQQRLYDAYLRGGPLAARPGRSLHERGLAVDVACPSSLNSLRANTAKQCGLHTPVKGEPWHMQLAPKRSPLVSTEPLHLVVIPSITYTDHGDLTVMNLRTISFNNVQLDKDGCGWVPCDAPVDRILDITQQGSFPPADGYWNKVAFGKQARAIPGTNTQSVIEIGGGKRRQVISFFVQVAT